jgi:hypothetical protein
VVDRIVSVRIATRRKDLVSVQIFR